MGEQAPTSCEDPPGGRVICRMCNQSYATTRVRVPLPGVRPVEAPCCKPCSAHLLEHALPPPDAPTLFPRPRFTIEHLMILAGVFGVVHIGTVLLARACVGPGNPAVVRGWTLRIALSTDVFGPVLALELLAFLWFQRLHWYKVTGRWVPLKRLAAEQSLLGPALPPGRKGASRNEWALRAFGLLLALRFIPSILSQTDRPWFPGYVFESFLSVLVVGYAGLALLALGFAASTPHLAADGRIDPVECAPGIGPPEGSRYDMTIRTEIRQPTDEMTAPEGAQTT